MSVFYLWMNCNDKKLFFLTNDKKRLFSQTFLKRLAFIPFLNFIFAKI